MLDVASQWLCEANAAEWKTMENTSDKVENQQQNKHVYINELIVVYPATLSRLVDPKPGLLAMVDCGTALEKIASLP